MRIVLSFDFPKSRAETRPWVHRLYLGCDPRKQKEGGWAGRERKEERTHTGMLWVVSTDEQGPVLLGPLRSRQKPSWKVSRRDAVGGRPEHRPQLQGAPRYERDPTSPMWLLSGEPWRRETETPALDSVLCTETHLSSVN